MALEYKNEEVVRYLKELGAKINKFIENGEIQLFKACHDGDEETVKYLMEHGVNINTENGSGETPLFYVCKKFKDYLHWGECRRGSVASNRIFSRT